MKVSVVMPVYNEMHTIEEITRRVLEQPMVQEVIIVDDYSTDGTRDKLSAYEGFDRIKVYLHDKNRGKGAALRTGFRYVTGNVVLVQDADLEYDPIDYPTLLKPIFEGKADVVFGSRFLGGLEGPTGCFIFGIM